MRPLPALPERIARLPQDARGYPIPFFVAMVEGAPDFRIADHAKWLFCLRHHRCWVCGDRLGTYLAFVVGPMCVVNRATADPACHLGCAEFSAAVCPFLSPPQAERRTANLPDQLTMPGVPILRNPGVAIVYVTTSYTVVPDNAKKPMLEMGPPKVVRCYAEGRRATTAEVDASFTSGIPALAALAARDGLVAKVELAGRILHARHILGLPALEPGVDPLTLGRVAPTLATSEP